MRSSRSGLPFDHPLWIVYSERHHGPAEADRARPWRHHHRGAAAERRCTTTSAAAISRTRSASATIGTRSTGWIMWNCQVSGLLGGTTCCIFDGSPGGHQGQAGLEDAVALRGRCRGDVLRRGRGVLRQLRQGGDRSSAASATCQDCARSARPDRRSAADTQAWFNERFAALVASQRQRTAQADIWWANISGGTDFAGAFIGANANCCRRRAQCNAACSARAVEAFNEQGQAVIDEVGELVCAEPLPSMPLVFLERCRQRALSLQLLRDISRTISTAAGADRCGGTATGSRSIPTGPASSMDGAMPPSTATACAWAPASSIPRSRPCRKVLDSLVVDLEYLGRDSYMPLFVVLRDGIASRCGDEGKDQQGGRGRPVPPLRARRDLCGRGGPRTLSGKKQELPIKRLLLGQPIDKSHQQGRHGQPRMPGLVPRLCAEPLEEDRRRVS